MKLTVQITLGTTRYGEPVVDAEGGEELPGVEFADEDDGQALDQALTALTQHVKERARWQIARRREIAAAALAAQRKEQALTS